MLDAEKREAAVMLRLPLADKQRLEQIARANDRSTSAEASRIVREHLEKTPPEWQRP